MPCSLGHSQEGEMKFLWMRNRTIKYHYTAVLIVLHLYDAQTYRTWQMTEGSCVSSLGVGICVQKISFLILNTLIAQCSPFKCFTQRKQLFWYDQLLMTNELFIADMIYGVWQIKTCICRWIQFCPCLFNSINWEYLNVNLHLNISMKIYSFLVSHLFCLGRNSLLWSLSNDLTIHRNFL